MKNIVTAALKKEAINREQSDKNGYKSAIRDCLQVFPVFIESNSSQTFPRHL